MSCPGCGQWSEYYDYCTSCEDDLSMPVPIKCSRCGKFMSMEGCNIMCEEKKLDAIEIAANKPTPNNGSKFKLTLGISPDEIAERRQCLAERRAAEWKQHAPEEREGRDL